MAGHRHVRPQEQSLEPLTETDRDEPMTDNPAGETSAVKSKIQPVKPSDQEIATHEACGIVLVLGVLGGQTLTNDGLKSRTVCLWRAWITASSLTETRVTRGSHSVPGGEDQAEYDDLEHACSLQRCGEPGGDQGKSSR